MTLQKPFLFPLLVIGLLAGCSLGDLQSAIVPAPTGTPTPTPTVTPTPIPLAARVNGEGIPLEEFEHEIARFELAQTHLGKDPSALGDYRRLVLQSMIEERVAAQAASAMGRKILADQIDAVVADARQARGGDSGFESWLKENFYSLAEFRDVVHRQLLVQSAADAVAAEVPLTAEQVHARHILVGNLDLANAIREEILGGKNFGELALAFSQDYSTSASGGDLGWFPRGILSVAEVEDAAFSLPDGQTSAVVQSRLGYHIIQTLEHDGARPLTASALEILRRKAVESWLAQQMQTAQVEIFI
jgi:parvulin-like peptidyl-prolyl isomerase